MFSPAPRAGTYIAPVSAHHATAKYSIRVMRIAISFSPAVSKRQSIGLGIVSSNEATTSIWLKALMVTSDYQRHHAV
jgi:hypothetical protein